MHRFRRSAATIAVIVVGAVALAACSSDDSTNGGASGSAALSGSIVISGSSTVEPISSFVAELFNETSPNVAISVDGPGTGDGFVLFCKGETDISDASRPIEPEEAKACKNAGIEYTELEVSLDGVTVMTNPANTGVECLNLGDLYALFGPESSGIDTWSGADSLAKQVGGSGGFPDAPLEITAPGEESGTYDAFIDLAGIGETAIAQGLPEAQAVALRNDYLGSPDDNVIITAMEGSDSSLGFVGFAYAQGAADQVKEIQIDGGSGCVSPTAATIADGSYPLSRSLFIYVNQAKLSTSDALKSFVDFYVSDDGLQTAVSETGYVPLPADRVATTRSAWAAASGS
ncbi:MAG: phosphate ABC transporter substrate-binding protein PstS family protein [Actinomycetota bacterium]